MLALCDVNSSALCICIQSNFRGAVHDAVLVRFIPQLAHGEDLLVPGSVSISLVSTNLAKPEGKLHLSSQWHQNLGGVPWTNVAAWHGAAPLVCSCVAWLWKAWMCWVHSRF